MHSATRSMDFTSTRLPHSSASPPPRRATSSTVPARDVFRHQGQHFSSSRTKSVHRHGHRGNRRAQWANRVTGVATTADEGGPACAPPTARPRSSRHSASRRLERDRRVNRILCQLSPNCRDSSYRPYSRRLLTGERHEPAFHDRPSPISPSQVMSSVSQGDVSSPPPKTLKIVRRAPPQPSPSLPGLPPSVSAM